MSAENPTPAPPSVTAVQRRFGPYLRPYMALTTLMFVMLIGQVIMDILGPRPMKFILDTVINRHKIHGPLGHFITAHVGNDRFVLLTLIILAFVMIALLDGLFSYLGNLLLSTVGQGFVFDVRRDLFAHVQRLSLQFHSSQRTGDLMTRLTGDIDNIQDMVVTVLSSNFVNGLTILAVVFVMLRLDWRYTLITMTVMPLIYLTARHYRCEIKSATRRARRSEGRVSSVVQEVISSIRVVEAFTREDFEQEQRSTPLLRPRTSPNSPRHSMTGSTPWGASGERARRVASGYASPSPGPLSGMHPC
jgi:subfamily B ATP-binding cassette protein MsbA